MATTGIKFNDHENYPKNARFECKSSKKTHPWRGKLTIAESLGIFTKANRAAEFFASKNRTNHLRGDLSLFSTRVITFAKSVHHARPSGRLLACAEIFIFERKSENKNSATALLCASLSNQLAEFKATGKLPRVLCVISRSADLVSSFYGFRQQNTRQAFVSFVPLIKTRSPKTGHFLDYAITQR